MKVFILPLLFLYRLSGCASFISLAGCQIEERRRSEAEVSLLPARPRQEAQGVAELGQPPVLHPGRRIHPLLYPVRPDVAVDENQVRLHHQGLRQVG